MRFIDQHIRTTLLCRSLVMSVVRRRLSVGHLARSEYAVQRGVFLFAHQENVPAEINQKIERLISAIE